MQRSREMSAPGFSTRARPGFRKMKGKTMTTQSHYRTVIVGAGPARLSAAYHLHDADYLLLEKEERIGGLCKTDHVPTPKGDFLFDHAGHIMFTKSPYIQELWSLLLGENIHWQDREAWI